MSDTEREERLARIYAVYPAAAIEAGYTPVNVATKDCPRCGVPIHAPDAPHLCADKVARMRTQEKWVQAVIDILVTDDNQPDHLRLTERELAEAIVKRLRNMGVEHD